MNYGWVDCKREIVRDWKRMSNRAWKQTCKIWGLACTKPSRFWNWALLRKTSRFPAPALAEAFGRDYSSDKGKYEKQIQLVAKMSVCMHRGSYLGKEVERVSIWSRWRNCSLSWLCRLDRIGWLGTQRWCRNIHLFRNPLNTRWMKDISVYNCKTKLHPDIID